MSHVIGRRHGRETYPTASRQASAPVAAVVTVTTPGPYHLIQGQASLLLASAAINLQAGSQVKVEALASLDGSVAAGRAFLSSPSVSSVVASQSFDTTQGTSFRTLNFLGITDAQPAGPVTIGIYLDVNGSAGARVDSAGSTVLVLTEIPAS